MYPMARDAWRLHPAARLFGVFSDTKLDLATVNVSNTGETCLLRQFPAFDGMRKLHLDPFDLLGADRSILPGER